MAQIFILLQYLVPQHLLSRCLGWLADLQGPAWLRDPLIGWFVRHFGVDMSEAEQPDYRLYPSFNAFFTRALRQGARPLADADVVSPVDGRVSQAGEIAGGRIFQAKGRSYSLVELLGGDPEWAARFADGSFCTIYLSPRDYHRVHMPLGGGLLATSYVPGDLFSVNPATVEGVDCLFARNERLVCYFDTALGPMALVLVGAMIVAGIDTVWSGRVVPPGGVSTLDYRAPPAPVRLEQGAEMGRFRLGSTVILLFPAGAVNWEAGVAAGTEFRLGSALASAIRPQETPAAPSMRR